MFGFGIKNVKAFIDSGDIEVAPITIIVGQNSCGKSCFIRFPVVLAQSFKSEWSETVRLYSDEHKFR